MALGVGVVVGWLAGWCAAAYFFLYTRWRWCVLTSFFSRRVRCAVYAYLFLLAAGLYLFAHRWVLWCVPLFSRRCVLTFFPLVYILLAFS